MTDTVTHNTSAHRFEVEIEGQTAFVDYHLEAGMMALPHTYTPPALRGRGLAARVVQAALDYARATGLKVIPQCWYAQSYMTAHPEYRDLLR